MPDRTCHDRGWSGLDHGEPPSRMDWHDYPKDKANQVRMTPGSAVRLMTRSPSGWGMIGGPD